MTTSPAAPLAEAGEVVSALSRRLRTDLPVSGSGFPVLRTLALLPFQSPTLVSFTKFELNETKFK